MPKRAGTDAGKWGRFVLLDRDGVINEAVRDGYLMRVDMVRLVPGAAWAIAELNRNGFGVVAVSNQQCVGKGLLSIGELERITQAIRDKVRNESGGAIADFLYCPHLASDGCSCRKPNPGLLIRAQERYGFDLGKTFFVGDTYSDIDTARRAGCRVIFVLSGLDAHRYKAGEPFPHHPDQVAADLAAAVALVLGSELESQT